MRTDRDAQFTRVPEQVANLSSAPVPASHSAPRRISSFGLLQGAPEVEIEHKGAVYRLRQTAQGKLILTK